MTLAIAGLLEKGSNPYSHINLESALCRLPFTFIHTNDCPLK